MKSQNRVKVVLNRHLLLRIYNHPTASHINLTTYGGNSDRKLIMPFLRLITPAATTTKLVTLETNLGRDSELCTLWLPSQLTKGKWKFRLDVVALLCWIFVKTHTIFTYNKSSSKQKYWQWLHQLDKNFQYRLLLSRKEKESLVREPKANLYSIVECSQYRRNTPSEKLTVML